jgi:hypothetical protein
MSNNRCMNAQAFLFGGNMKRLLLTLIVLFAMCCLVQPSFGAKKVPVVEKTVAKKQANARNGIFGPLGGGEVPFPFGSEVPFPWRSIEGTYFASSDDYEAYFSLEVMYEDNEPALKVKHYENREGRLFGEGGGFAQSDNRIVRAAMHGRNGLNYMVFLRSFGRIEIDGRTIDHAMVLTIRSFGPRVPNSREWHFLLRKVSSQPVNYRQRR